MIYKIQVSCKEQYFAFAGAGGGCPQTGLYDIKDCKFTQEKNRYKKEYVDWGKHSLKSEWQIFEYIQLGFGKQYTVKIIFLCEAESDVMMIKLRYNGNVVEYDYDNIKNILLDFHDRKIDF